MTFRSASLAALLLPLSLALAAPALAQQDTVVLAGGKTQNVKITALDLEGIAYQVPSGTASIKWSALESFRFANEPGLYKAMDLIESGEIQPALAPLKEIVGNAKARAAVRQEALHLLGTASLRAGDVDGAVQALSKSIEEFPKGYHVVADGGLLLSCHLGRKDAAAVKKVSDGLRAAAASGDSSLKASVDVLWGRALLEQDKTSEAQAAFEKAANTGGIRDDVRAAARIGAARCIALSGQAADAENRLKAVIAEAPTTQLAEAWNALGDIALAKAKAAGRSADGVRDALFCYLRTIVMYAPGPSDPSDEMERALAGASESFRALADLETNAEKKKALIEKAKTEAQRLAGWYPNSRFGNKRN